MCKWHFLVSLEESKQTKEKKRNLLAHMTLKQTKGTLTKEMIPTQHRINDLVHVHSVNEPNQT